ncbi:MAG: FAD-dependent oxidoreductase, partial [Pseudohongiellaceae bacterium]
AVGDREISAEKIVVSTGSRPAPPPYSELPVWTSDDLFPLETTPPASLIVVGGGFVGCEMAAFFAGVGTRVQLFNRGDRLLGREDRDIENVFRTEFAKEVETHCDAELEMLSWDGRQFTAAFDIQGKKQQCTAERILFAIGRVPNTEQLQLEKTGLATDQRGFLPVNEWLETRVPGIYATGDVNGRYMLQHAASYEVYYLRQRFLKGLQEPIDERLVAHAVFSCPEVASIGLTEDQVRERGIPYVAVLEDWLASARAMALRIHYPRIKLIVARQTYEILGCHLVGPESATLLHQVLAVMRLKNDVRELAEMIYIHPALNECLLAAAVKAVGKIELQHQAE